MRTIGIFAGTFDPIHHGHIQFALKALKAGKLGSVILVPESKPHRGKQPIVELSHRRSMVQLAIKPYPELQLGDMGPGQFSIRKTLPVLIRTYGEKLAFLIGSDVFMTMSEQSWPDLPQLLQYPLIVGMRDDAETERITRQAKSLGANITLIETDHADHASRHVRVSANGHPFIDPSVAGYIAKHTLYGSST